MNTFNILKEYILNELTILDKKLEEAHKRKEVVEENLKILLTFQESLVADIEKVDLDKLAEVIKVFGHNLDSELSRLNEIKKINKYLSNPNITSIGVKREALIFLEEFKEKIKIIHKENTIQKIERNTIIKSYEEDKIKYSSYLKLFNEKGFVKEISLEEINDFFDFLESSQIDKKVVLDIIAIYTIHTLEKRHSQRKDETEVDIEAKIDKNSEVLFEDKTREEVKRDTIIAAFSVEEQKVLKEIEALIEEHKAKEHDQLFELVKMLFSDFTINDRESMYAVGNSLDWPTIVADYYVNLLPNINQNKDEILNIFRFILEVNSRHISMNSEREKLDKQIKIFNEINEAIEEITNNYYSNSGSIYSNISDKNIKDINNIIFNLGTLSQNTSVRIEEESIDSVEIENVNKRLREMISRYRELSSKKDEENKQTPEHPTEDIAPYNLNTTKSIVLLLKDEDGYFGGC